MTNGTSVIRILIVDDDEDDFFITSEYIKGVGANNFHIDWCFRYKDALEFMKNGAYHIYFVDYRLGAKTGLDLIKEAIHEHCEEPLVLLTGKGNPAVDREAMQVGAVDYLVKTELNPEKLERCIRYSLDRAASLKALRANERKYRNIFERSKDAVFIADEQLAFRDVNEAAAQFLGYSREELLHMSLPDIVESAVAKNILRSYLELKGEVNDMEVEIVTKSREKKNGVVSATHEVNTNGTHYIQGIIHDITNLKRAEKATLQIEKLAAAGRLVRTLAHEVRNPLNNINISVEQLFEDIPGEDTRLYLAIIHRNSNRIGDLITELLNFSKPADIILEKRLLQTIADESISAALDRITLQRINMQISYPDEPAYVMADISKLKIALLNIIINAIEAMESKNGELCITVSAGDEFHRLQISDNGCGITEDNLSRLYEPYFTSKRNGMGLGLATTLNILQSHKAQIDVTSTLNVGTDFIITFPNADYEAKE